MADEAGIPPAPAATAPPATAAAAGLAAVYRDDPAIAALIGPGGPYEVEERVIDGVPLRCFARGLRTIVDSFLLGANHGDAVQIVYGDERHTFAQMHLRTLAVAKALRDTYGVGVGDRVAISMRNLPEYVVCFWAGAVLGAIVVPLNSWWTGPELVYGLSNAQAKVAFVDAERLDRVLGAGHGAARGALVAVRAASVPEGVVAFDDLAGGEPLSTDEVATLEPDDPVAILYTSGTTGTPRGALLTSRNLLSNLMNMAFMGTRAALRAGVTPSRPSGQPASLASGPLFHIGGVSGMISGPMSGMKMVLMHKWNVDEAIALIQREAITNVGGVPAVARQLIEHPRFGELSGVRGLPLGGAAVPPDLPRKAAERLRGAQLLNGYGLTETTAAVVSNVGADYVARPDSVGIPNLTADCRVEDPVGNLLGVGEVGELCFRSPQVAKGYWNDEAATRSSFVDGWFHSGDLGYVDADGYVYVVDRLKDVVIRGGENVYCAEVEAVLYEHPAVAEVAVIGVPEAAMGERVCAVVVARTGHRPTLAELRAFAGQRLAAFKCPEALWLTGELPKTATEKVAKAQLRAFVNDGSPGVERLW